jgi:hypothetical protein
MRDLPLSALGQLQTRARLASSLNYTGRCDDDGTEPFRNLHIGFTRTITKWTADTNKGWVGYYNTRSTTLSARSFCGRGLGSLASP